MENKKKAAAAISAVVSYIRQEEDTIRLQLASGHPVSPAPSSSNQWGTSGRQAIMQTRNLMQMKAFHGFRQRP